MQRLLAICLAGGFLTAQAAWSGTMAITGQGSASGTPDIATMSMGVSHEAAIAQNAMDWVAKDVNEMLSRLKEAGLEDKDLQTSSISLYPVWSRSDRGATRTVTGYSATVSLRVVLRDLDRLGDVLSQVVSAGGNRFNGLSLGIEDTSGLEAEARAAAIRDARMKADQYAEAAGVTITGIETISESGGGGGPYPVVRMADAVMGAESMEVARGENNIIQSVTVVFSFE